MRTKIQTLALAALSTAYVLNATHAMADVNVIGKKISVASAQTPPSLPTYPTFLAVATVNVPTSYKSRTQFLDISTSVQEGCPGGGQILGMVKVGGTSIEPSPGLPFYEAGGPNSETAGRQWVVVPESAGGLPVAPGALVELLLSQTGTGSDCYAGGIALTVRAAK